MAKPDDSPTMSQGNDLRITQLLRQALGDARRDIAAVVRLARESSSGDPARQTAQHPVNAVRRRSGAILVLVAVGALVLIGLAVVSRGPTPLPDYTGAWMITAGGGDQGGINIGADGDTVWFFKDHVMQASNDGSTYSANYVEGNDGSISVSGMGMTITWEARLSNDNNTLTLTRGGSTIVLAREH